MSIVGIFFLFCYYGLLCFGGGSALTPVYIEDLVNTRGWMTIQEFGNLAAVSQMTPGPIGVNMATFFGFRNAGLLGGLAATVGLLTPSYFLMLAALKSLRRWQDSSTVKGIMRGIRPATVGMMLAAQLIYFGMSIFSDQIPWSELFLHLSVPDGFHVRPVALAVFVLSSVLLCKTKIGIMPVIFGSAIIGALL